MKSVGPVISPEEVSVGPAVTVCSGAMRRANASAVARSHWSARARIGSSRRRSAVTGALPSLATAASASESSNSSRNRVGSSSSSQRVGRSSTVTPCSPSGGTTWLPGGSRAASVTSRMWGEAGRSSAPNRGRSLRSGGSSAARSASEVVTIRLGPTASDCWALWACGSHFSQSQWAQVLLGREHRDHQVLGGVERRRRAEHRPGQRPGRLLRAAQLDPVEGPQVDAGRQVGLQPVDDEQPVQRRGGGRVDLVDGGALGRDQLQGQRLRADAVPDVQEVGVGAAVLPHPGPLLRQRGQGGRLGVVPGQGPPLLVGGLARHLAHVGEVAQVLRARAGDLLRPLLPLPVQLDDDEAEGREEEHAGRDVAATAGASTPSWPPGRSSRGCRASGWRSSGRRWRPRAARSGAAAGARSARWAAPARRAERPAASYSTGAPRGRWSAAMIGGPDRERLPCRRRPARQERRANEGDDGWQGWGPRAASPSACTARRECSTCWSRPAPPAPTSPGSTPPAPDSPRSR